MKVCVKIGFLLMNSREFAQSWATAFLEKWHLSEVAKGAKWLAKTNGLRYLLGDFESSRKKP